MRSPPSRGSSPWSARRFSAAPSTIKSAHNSATLQVHGIEPQYQAIRTIDVERGRMFGVNDEEEARRVAIIGADATAQLFGTRDSLGQRVYLNGLPYTVIGTHPEEGPGQQLQRAGQRQGVRAVLGDAARLSAAGRGAGRAVEPDRVAARVGGGSAAGGSRRTDGPHRGRRLAARAGGQAHPGAAAPLRSDRSQCRGHVGHVTRDADVRPDDRAHELVLRAGQRGDAGTRRPGRHEHHAGGRSRAHTGNRRAQGARRHDSSRAAPVLSRRLPAHDAQRHHRVRRGPCAVLPA